MEELEVMDEIVEEETVETADDHIDDVEDHIDDTEEDFFETEEEIEEETKEETVEENFELKYMDEIKKVSKDELISLGQKGLNYDKVKNELENLKQYKDDILFINDLVEKSGLSKEEYFNLIKNNIEKAEIDSRVKELTNSGVDEEVARYTANLEYENRTLKETKKKAEIKKEQEEAKIKSLATEIESFKSLYPEVKKLPKEVEEAVNQGKNLLTSYQDHLLKQQEMKIKQLEQTIKDELYKIFMDK